MKDRPTDGTADGGFALPLWSEMSAGDRAAMRRLAREESVGGWNAAILVAREEPGGAGELLPTLESLVCRPPVIPAESMASVPMSSSQMADSAARATSPRKAAGGERRIPPAMQCAAAEAWCRVLEKQSVDGKEDADVLDRMAPAGRALELTRLPNVVQGELMIGLARSIAPALIPGVGEALVPPRVSRSDAPRATVELRRGAMEACVVHASLGRALSRDWDAELWPEAILECRNDPDTRVRRMFGQWLARGGSPEALRLLTAQLSDAEIRVREEAHLCLGKLGTDGARGVLLKQAKRPEERVREFAARGLSEFGPRELAALAKDSAGNVRMAVAEGLARFPTREAAVLMRSLVHDADSQVQLAAARSISDWPDSLAIPVLLESLRSGARQSREAAWQALCERVQQVEGFDIDAAADERRLAVDRLVAKHQLPVGLLASPDESPSVAMRGSASSDRTESLRRAVRTLMREAPGTPSFEEAWNVARRWTAEDVAAIERELMDGGAMGTGVVERELLPRLSRAHAAAMELESGDVFTRRHGAQTLAELSREATLSSLVMRRIAGPLSREQDQLVWRYVMQAIASDAAAEATPLLELAVHSTWPDVRILGCEAIRRRGQASFAPALLPLLSDSNKPVQLAALEAAGACRNPMVLEGLPARGDAPAVPGVRSLLASPDARVQFVAAATMARLGDEQGMNELARLAFHESPMVREEAARIMGETGQARFIDPLIRLGWTEPSPRVRRAVLAALDSLVPPEKRPRLGSATTEDGMMRAWMEWQKLAH